MPTASRPDSSRALDLVAGLILILTAPCGALDLPWEKESPPEPTRAPTNALPVPPAPSPPKSGDPDVDVPSTLPETPPAEPLREETLEQLKPRAEAGDAKAQFELGEAYREGTRGAEPNPGEAFWWTMKAAKQGHPAAMCMIGFDYAKGAAAARDYAKAHEWLRKAAAAGSAEAMGGLAALYHEGLGVGQDFVLAREWFRKAAELGNVDAQTDLATMCEKGQGGPADPDEAARWRARAAQGGR